MNNLYHKFRDISENRTKAIIITPGVSYSFPDIEVFSSKIATLLSRFGLQAGDRLAAQVEKSEYGLFLYLACLRSGIIYLPLNNTYTQDELSYFFTDAEPKLIVCDPSNEEVIKNIKGAEKSLIKTLDSKGQGSLMAELATAEVKPDVYHAEPDETAVILYTSGTTGKPKGAMITHQGLFSNAQDLNVVWKITEHDTLLHMLPLFHVHGLFFAFHTILLAGASLFLLPKFDLHLFFEYLPKATIFMGVPTYYTRLLGDRRLSRQSCGRMRLFISGSAPLLPATFEQFYEQSGYTILERYGMTETGINTSNPLEGKRKVGSVGLALPHVQVRVVDDHDKPVSLGEVGHIQVKGPNLFKGYWLKPEKTQEDMTVDGFFRTGDLGGWDEEGYLSIVGRSKDMVITGGLNVYPKEIELTIDSLDGVNESAIIGLIHPDFGEAVVAVVAADQNKVAESDILEAVKKSHAGYKCPKKIFFVTELPKNTMGKVQKNVLRQQYAETFETLLH